MIRPIRQSLTATEAEKVRKLLRDFEKHSKTTISYLGVGDAMGGRLHAKKADKAIKDVIKILQQPG